jgi:hypothetical protein
MRKIAAVVGVISLFTFILLVRAGDDAKVRDLIARAIKAHGGAENLDKWKASTLKTKGKILDLDYTAQTSIQLPDRTRTEARSHLGKLLQVIDGDKGWIQLGGGTTRECVKEEVAEMREQLNAMRIARLTVLTDKEYKLTLAGEEKIDGRPAIGVRVEHAGYRDVYLYFDKENNLLAKIQTRIKDPLRGGEEVVAETWYGDYKKVNGVMTAHKFTIKYDGKVYNDGEVVEAKYAEKLDDSVFEKP